MNRPRYRHRYRYSLEGYIDEMETYVDYLEKMVLEKKNGERGNRRKIGVVTIQHC